MTLELFNQYLAQYGAVAIFLIVLLEYMNMPGFPAGIIMPLAGIWAAQGKLPFWQALVITVAAGLLGSLLLYFLGRFGGNVFLHWYLRKFPKQQPAIEKNFSLLRRHGSWGVFISKLIPMVRTLISIPAGVIKMNLAAYSCSSFLGVLVWNLFFVGAGYFLGEQVLAYLH